MLFPLRSLALALVLTTPVFAGRTGHVALKGPIDGVVLDTFKISLSNTIIAELHYNTKDQDSIKEFINSKLIQSDIYLKLYATQLVTTEDSSYYLEKKAELKKIDQELNSQPTKEVLEKKEKVLLELSILNPEKSFSFYNRWLRMIFKSDAVSDNADTDTFCYFRAWLNTLLIKRFPNKKGFAYNLGITYYNHGMDIINSLSQPGKADVTDQKMDKSLRFMKKALYYLELAR